ncbi:SPOR domain-containing protein [Thalassolituus sp. LLYu03]|uniref:SPOR domain-containing protein n=1 Tax=Thalassolituus sp. LLYu03 TaxID=3421656 RepID=UPI003D2A04D4
MEQHLKKRILGAFVTVIAIAIALPIVLDGSRSQIGLTSDMPPIPETPDWAYVEDERKVRIELEQLDSGEAAEQIAVPESEIVEQNAPLPPGAKMDRTSLDSANIPYAWTLQLGAFSDDKNAYALRDKLRDKGYKAYTQKFPQDTLTRVYVGPEVQRSEIEALQKKLQAELKQQDIPVKRYRAES